MPLLRWGHADALAESIATPDTKPVLHGDNRSTPRRPRQQLDEELLKPLGLTKYRLAKNIGVPAQRIGDIVAGKRAITADTDLRLCRYFGLSDGWWLRGQANYDTAVAREAMGGALSRVPRCQLLAA